LVDYLVNDVLTLSLIALESNRHHRYVRNVAGKRNVNRIRAALLALDEADDGLAALDAARRTRISAEALEGDLVKAARRAGHSWGDIGRLYNMTKQGAQQRFSERDGH
jgi:hypothetical protein